MEVAKYKQKIDTDKSTCLCEKDFLFYFDIHVSYLSIKRNVSYIDEKIKQNILEGLVVIKIPI